MVREEADDELKNSARPRERELELIKFFEIIIGSLESYILYKDHDTHVHPIQRQLSQ